MAPRLRDVRGELARRSARLPDWLSSAYHGAVLSRPRPLHHVAPSSAALCCAFCRCALADAAPQTQCLCFQCVDAADKGVVQSCGKFKSVANPGVSRRTLATSPVLQPCILTTDGPARARSAGLVCILWPFEIVSPVSMKLNPIDVVTNTK